MKKEIDRMFLGFSWGGQRKPKRRCRIYMVEWQDQDRTWTTEVRVWETLYDCVSSLLKVGI